MVEVLRQIALWSAAYLAVAIVPLGVALVGQRPAGRGFLIELGVGLGLVGFAMLGLQFVTTTRFRRIAPYFGTDAKIQFHRETGILAAAFVIAHPVLLILAEPQYVEFFNPAANLPRAVFLSGATAALVLLIVLPLWRLRLRISYEWWRLTHGGLALVVMLVGTAHALQVAHYVSGVAKQAFWVAGGVLAAGLLLHTRVVKPFRMRRSPWRVVTVSPDCPGVFRLVLEPDGHPGMRFQAGQYAWLTIGSTPFTLQQHPFSFVSSDADPRRIEFGIKELGDFTGTLKDVQPGTGAYLEGPYGSFTLDRRAAGAVFLVGGIGITPALSMLRSCRDRNDLRPLLLIYANDRREEIAFYDELEELTRQLKLEIVHVLAEPPVDWNGESGLVTSDLLARRLADRLSLDLQYFVCGPAPMMDAVERSLAQLGVAPWRLHSERFDLV